MKRIIPKDYHLGFARSSSFDSSCEVLNADKLDQSFSNFDFKQVGDFFKSDEGKTAVDSAVTVVNTLGGKPVGDTGSSSTSSTPDKTNNTPDATKKEFKIAGMNPITFGLVSVGTIVAISLVVIFVKNKNKVA